MLLIFILSLQSALFLFLLADYKQLACQWMVCIVQHDRQCSHLSTHSIAVYYYYFSVEQLITTSLYHGGWTVEGSVVPVQIGPL